jgi:hypothetical protein
VDSKHWRGVVAVNEFDVNGKRTTLTAVNATAIRRKMMATMLLTTS